MQEQSFCFDESGERYDAVSTDYVAANRGTNVASIILGTGEAVGGTPIRGVAPGATVLYCNSMITTAAPHGGEDPWNLAGLGGQVIDHQVYSGMEH